MAGEVIKCVLIIFNPIIGPQYLELYFFFNVEFSDNFKYKYCGAEGLNVLDFDF